MCTLTIISRGDNNQRRVRLQCNRDESRLRPGAKPPERRICGERQVLMPVDPISDGTWIGVSNAPLAAVLMNVYIAQAEQQVEILPRTRPLVSRGTIIPQVLAASDLANAVERLNAINPRDFEPFRLILVNHSHWLEVVWAAEQLSIDLAKPLDDSLFFTSSGLGGDDIVARPRRQLFDEMLQTDADPDAIALAAKQDAFHRHVWPGREYASVWMTRPEARTQSITWCELAAHEVTMRYAQRDWGDGLAVGDELHLTIP